MPRVVFTEKKQQQAMRPQSSDEMKWPWVLHTRVMAIINRLKEIYIDPANILCVHPFPYPSLLKSNTC